MRDHEAVSTGSFHATLQPSVFRDGIFAASMALSGAAALVADEIGLLALDLAMALSVVAAVAFLIQHARLGNLIIVVQVLAVFLFSLFAVIVLNLFDYVVAEPGFDFAAFSFDGVQLALGVNNFALAAEGLVLSLMPGIRNRSSLFGELRGYAGLHRPSQPVAFGRWLAGSWMLILGVLLFTPNVSQFPYPENFGEPGNLPMTPRIFLILIPYSLFLRTLLDSGFRTTERSFLARVTYYVAVYAIGLLGGSRGAVVGILISTWIVDAFFSRDKKSLKVLWSVLGFAFVVFSIVLWPYMRVEISNVGWLQALLLAIDQSTAPFSRSLRMDGFVLGDVPMLGQSLFHFLYAIELVSHGESYRLQTFINLIPQQLPEFLDGVLWVRPENDAVLLKEYFLHAGGFYSLANAYWNHGAIVAVAFAAALTWVIGLVEIAFKRKAAPYVIAYFAFLYLVPVNMYYGIQGLMRGLEFGVLAFVAVWVIFDRRGRRGGGESPPRRTLMSHPR